MSLEIWLIHMIWFEEGVTKVNRIAQSRIYLIYRAVQNPFGETGQENICVDNLNGKKQEAQ